MNFMVIENNLFRDSDIKSLKLENEDYKVSIFYYGDLQNDLDNDTVDRNQISMNVKPKSDEFGLKFMHKDVFIEITGMPLIMIKDVEDVSIRLNRAKESAIALKRILIDTFKIDMD